MFALPHHSPGVSSSPANVTVDWSAIESPVETEHAQDALIAWMSDCPRMSAVRVYLPSTNRRGALRKLQKSLLSLGCTVTCRVRPA